MFPELGVIINQILDQINATQERLETVITYTKK